MRSLLSRQMQEKQLREQVEKAENDEQAVIWRTDKDNYELEEKRLASKIQGINKENQEFLRRQMEEKAQKSRLRRMNKQEFNYSPKIKGLQYQRAYLEYLISKYWGIKFSLNDE